MIKFKTSEPNLSMGQTWFWEKDSVVSYNLWKGKNRGVGEGKGKTYLSFFKTILRSQYNTVCDVTGEKENILISKDIWLSGR